MPLDRSDHRDLVALRRRLHEAPELAGEEAATADRIVSFLARLQPDVVLTGLGGHGVAALLRGADGGRPVLARCELDGLPIDETLDLPYSSRVPGVAHKCGHDGHMAMVLGAGILQRCSRRRGERPPGLALLFQPAEETGVGAAAVLADGRLDAWDPGPTLALHNLPGHELGAVVVRDGTFSCASCGLAITLRGAATHAATPEQGKSPAPAVVDLVDGLPRLAAPRGEGPLTLVTVVHASLGTPGFGVAPGTARVMATLRAETAGSLDALRRRAVDRATAAAAKAGVEIELSWHDEFPPTVCCPEHVAAVRAAAAELGRPVIELAAPMPFSEDVALLCARYGGAVFGLGAGRDAPPLHDGRYDFPDDLIPVGAELLLAAARRVGASTG